MGRTVSVTRVAAVAAILTTGCASTGERAGVAVGGDWRALVTDADRTRIRTWRDGFTKALAMVRKARGADPVDAQGPLLRPDAAIDGPMPPPGDYSCRTVRLGGTGADPRAVVAVPPERCRITIADGVLVLAKTDGAQRPVGRLYPDGAMRMIFLGTMRMADESRALDYGRDLGRNMAGIVERIGPRTWRLVLPWPQWGSTLEVVELAPAG